MAKKDGSSPKKSAAPHTPEVVPGDTGKGAKKAAKPASVSRTDDQNPPQVAQEVPKTKPATLAAQPSAAATTPAPAGKSAPSQATPAAAPAKPAVSAVKPPKPITWDDIAQRAYYIAQSGTGGSEDDNWLRAEAELKREAGLA